MALDLLHRLRWRNLARAVAVVAFVAVVVAWPRVGPPPSRLPGSAAVPLVKPAAPVVAEPDRGRPPGAAPVVAEPDRGRPPVRERGRRRRTAKRRERGRRRAVVRRPEATPRRGGAVSPRGDSSAERLSPAQRAPTVPRAAPPSGDPVQEEFGIEGG